ncbi:hypothetical protein EYF80_009911 [Liparis tanakae]|uniref:Uncharacterized protein n=1 Tax=Liparis tanakae TaxID=230148 RepID=A0A4Z2IQS3_9TELE|nr:hypothetical protein EYF80_009911 [Liparis tanakae]
MSHSAVTSCSHGIGSWYCSRYLQRQRGGAGAHLCAMSLSSLVRTLASDVIPATLHAMSLRGHGEGRHLLGEEHLVQQLVDVPPLGGQQHAVAGEDAQAAAGVADGLHGVLDLIQAPCGRMGMRERSDKRREVKNKTRRFPSRTGGRGALTLRGEDGRSRIVSAGLKEGTGKQHEPTQLLLTAASTSSTSQEGLLARARGEATLHLFKTQRFTQNYS